jgi:hypothetical protein
MVEAIIYSRASVLRLVWNRVLGGQVRQVVWCKAMSNVLGVFGRL